jgi:hypothetical protein
MMRLANVQLQWLKMEEGGRRQPFVGFQYTPTARFFGENEYFSVVLRFPSNHPNPSQGKLTLLFPDLQDVQKRLVPGCKLEITEGSRIVAHCQVVSLEMPDLETAMAKGN